VEPLADFFADLDAELKNARAGSSKASFIRQFVTNLSTFLGESRMCLGAVADLATEKFPSVGRGYFTAVARKSWTVEIDDNGVEWIRTDRPKGRWRK